ncbi:MAG: 8-oxo-dGTP diphosphatase [Candidatus Micrarchaeota archaeon]|nr:8-oxo-dGTP diphosphatase [Candidatus Micrarchaeota archaeon]MDE1823686.1 8-oxo-dGTP diphosphatase [Candidatus Micrarchaeota archaeon]MDE1849791.1 8-oxo-dGTP diphosphatase [Candidatus Micrarchaeota archaeon]
MTVRATNCHIIDRKKGRMLLKLATRGVSKGKWNCLGGKIEKGESASNGAIREVYEESGLRIRKPFYHGTLMFHVYGKVFNVSLFSTSSFSGRMRRTDEGRLKWFYFDKLPYGEMWDDDKYWIVPMLHGRVFDSEFYYDKRNKKVIKAVIRIRN